MDNASSLPCAVLRSPTDIRYAEAIRAYQGCPTLAVTRGGRIFLGWYAGGSMEPHMDNYNLLVYSDDGGKSWSPPLLVIPSSRERGTHALDIQLFTDPAGTLHVMWVQNNAVPQPEQLPDRKPGRPLACVDGWMFDDFRHAEWEVLCRDPDAAEPEFTEPRFVFPGFMRCKPTFLSENEWLCFAYNQLDDRYHFYRTTDGGVTYTPGLGSKKLHTYFDESMAYRRTDGSIRMLARCELGQLAESCSYDGGLTWTETRKSGLDSPSSRFFIARLPSGRILRVGNDDTAIRRKMTVWLSEDDGATWPYRKCLDKRQDLSYPDADWHDGRILLTFDRGRTTDREILFTSFTEQDILQQAEIPVSVVSRPAQYPAGPDVVRAILKSRLIVILRDVPKEKILSVADALWDGGVRILEVTYHADGSTDEDTTEKIRLLTRHFGEKMLVGAGTVMTRHQVRLARSAGAVLIISPDTDPDVIRESRTLGMVSIPGAFTPTEIAAAVRAGADLVKVFPAAALGPDYFKAVLAPLAGTHLLAVGGIRPDTVRSWLRAGAEGFGISSGIVPADAVARGDYASITALAGQFLSEMREEDR